MIAEIKTYRDELGRTVKTVCPEEGQGQGSIAFIGVERVKTKDGLEQDWEFFFPEDVTNLTEAFKRFDEVFQRRLDERNEKIVDKKTKAEKE